MPSWVVPSVAAEMWGVSVEHILAEVAQGRVRSRQVGQMLFVDIDPADAAAIEAEQAESRPTPYRRSLAWSPIGAQPQAQPVITAAERDALLDDGEDRPTKPLDEAELENSLQQDDDAPLADWRQVRARVATQRRPPMPRREAAA